MIFGQVVGEGQGWRHKVRPGSYSFQEHAIGTRERHYHKGAFSLSSGPVSPAPCLGGPKWGLSSLVWGLLVPTDAPTSKGKSWLYYWSKWPGFQRQPLLCRGVKLAAVACEPRFLLIPRAGNSSQSEAVGRSSVVWSRMLIGQTPAEWAPSGSLWKAQVANLHTECKYICSDHLIKLNLEFAWVSKFQSILTVCFGKEQVRCVYSVLHPRVEV